MMGVAETTGGPPLVALTTSEVRTARTLRPITHGEPTPHEVALAVPYVHAIEQAGGLPVIVPPLGLVKPDSLLEYVDGLCLPGGPDLDPSTYDAPEHPQLGPFDPEVDRFELGLIRLMDSHERPILGICRGAQALNVARGGSLIQHLPDLVGTLDHRQSTPGNQTSHEVLLESGTRLAGLLGGQASLDVNSFHHQGIDRLGIGLRPVAFAPDGTIEALEAEDRDFCVGVQWHAETLVQREEQVALFRAFIEACARVKALAVD